MATDSPITAETTVSRVYETSPEAGGTLRSRGIDSCCSGPLTLRQAAEARGISLEELLGAVRAALPAGQTEVCPAPVVTGADSIRNILARHPHTAVVFEKFGLMGCGGAAGPDERIDFFAKMHRVDGDAMVTELNAAIARGPDPSAPMPDASRAMATSVYRPFLKGSIWCTLTLGATFGAVNLVSMYATTLKIPASHHHVHALFQVWGFVLLFIMGVAYHAVPRFLGAELVRPGLARATFWLVLLGILCGSYGGFGEFFPGALPAFGVGAGMILAGVSCWAYLIGATWARAGFPRDASHPFLALGTLWWVAGAALLAIAAGVAIARNDSASLAPFYESVYAATLYGGTLAWIQGMFLRSGPIFLGLRKTRAGFVWVSFLTGLIGTVCAIMGAIPVGFLTDVRLQNVGLLGVAVSVLTFVIGVRPFEGDGGHFTDGDRGFVRVVRIAFVSSLVFALVGGGYAIAHLTGHYPSQWTYDGARHAYALGFVTLMIFGMASRIVPIFEGAPLQWPTLRTWGAYSIAAGVLLREAEVLASIRLEPWLLTLTGLSGVVAAGGVILCGASLLRTLRAGARAASPSVSVGEVPIGREANVAALVAAHPEALPILIEAGLTPLANPVLRNTMARMVTLERGCSMHGIDVDDVLEKIRRACTHQPAVARTFDV